MNIFGKAYKTWSYYEHSVKKEDWCFLVWKVELVNISTKCC